jgi:NTP pyrophosphatase (non-canonical NTP hydrolase)
MRKTIEELSIEHGIWSHETFPKGTAHGAMLHAAREVNEVIQEIDKGPATYDMAKEYADVIFCVLDSARRNNISLAEIINAGDDKLQINKERKWKDNGDGSYSHIK